MKRILFAMAALCLTAAGQSYDSYTVSFSTTLAAAGTALSVQLPGAGSNVTEVSELTVQTSDACLVRLERNGNAATTGNATAATIVALNPESTPASLDSGRGGTPKVTAWFGTNIPTGTPVSPNWTVPAGAILPFGGGRIMNTVTGLTSNYILRILSPCTGNVALFFSVRVRR